jgi:hypothetical protein
MQQKMLIRLDRLDGHVLEDKVAKNPPAFLGREFRKCRVLERAEFVDGLEGRLPEETLADLMRADVIATARRQDLAVHLLVEASCTADADDIDRGKAAIRPCLPEPRHGREASTSSSFAATLFTQPARNRSGTVNPSFSTEAYSSGRRPRSVAIVKSMPYVGRGSP